jgi:hypothetical protein
MTCGVPWRDRPFIDYLCEVDRLLHERYGITADDLDAVAAAQEAGETPREHVAWQAGPNTLESQADIGQILAVNWMAPLDNPEGDR